MRCLPACLCACLLLLPACFACCLHLLLCLPAAGDGGVCALAACCEVVRSAVAAIVLWMLCLGSRGGQGKGSRQASKRRGRREEEVVCAVVPGVAIPGTHRPGTPLTLPGLWSPGPPDRRHAPTGRNWGAPPPGFLTCLPLCVRCCCCCPWLLLLLLPACVLACCCWVAGNRREHSLPIPVCAHDGLCLLSACGAGIWRRGTGQVRTGRHGP